MCEKAKKLKDIRVYYHRTQAIPSHGQDSSVGFLLGPCKTNLHTKEFLVRDTSILKSARIRVTDTESRRR